MVSEPVSRDLRGPAGGGVFAGVFEGVFDARERALLAQVEPSLADGLELKRWFDDVDASNGYAQRFEVVSEFNRPDSSYGFFDEAPVAGRRLKVMGVVQEQLYDQPKSPRGYEAVAAEWLRGQVRHFVLRYFMRVSSFRQPGAVVDTGRKPAPGYLEALSWCPTEEDNREGFGFEQLYYKRKADGAVGKFGDDERFAIVDLRELGKTYDWIVVKVRVFDFKFNLKLRRPGSPEIVIPLAEESYLVLSPEFISDREQPRPGELGRYGLGYAFLRDPASSSFLAYGPGQFAAAFQTIQFKVLPSGETRVCMSFVVNRPDRVVNLSLNPIDWTLRMADLFSLGLSSRLLKPVAGALDRVRGGGVDPILGSISLAGALTGGFSQRELCISREQLEKVFLVRHFLQHYQTIAGSLMTWRSVPDWCDEAALPDWVQRGRAL